MNIMIEVKYIEMLITNTRKMSNESDISYKHYAHIVYQQNVNIFGGLSKKSLSKTNYFSEKSSLLKKTFLLDFR